MADEGANIVGTAAVAVEADLTQFVDQLSAAIKRATEQTIKIPVIAEVSSARSSRGAVKNENPPRDAEAAAAATSTTGVSRARRAPYSIEVDVGNLRGQIEAALSAPFQIQVEVRGGERAAEGGESVGTEGGTDQSKILRSVKGLTDAISADKAEVQGGEHAATGGQPAVNVAVPETVATQHAEPPPEFTKTLRGVKGLTDAISQLHVQLREAFGKAGQPFGSPSSTGNPLDELSDIVGAFGSDLREYVRVEKFKTKAGTERERVVGGAVKEKLSALGLPADVVQGVTNAANAVVKLSASNGSSKTAAPFGAQVREVFAAAPVTHTAPAGATLSVHERAQAAYQAQQIAGVETATNPIPTSVKTVARETQPAAAEAPEDLSPVRVAALISDAQNKSAGELRKSINESRPVSFATEIPEAAKRDVIDPSVQAIIGARLEAERSGGLQGERGGVNVKAKQPRTATGPVGGPPVPDQERGVRSPETDIAAARDLGDQPNKNDRSLRGRGLVPFAGAPQGQLNLEPFLRFAERGGFQNIVEELSGKAVHATKKDVEQGRAEVVGQQISGKGTRRRLSATGETAGDLLESEEALRRVARSGKAFTLPNAGVEGQVRRVKPSDALKSAVGEHLNLSTADLEELFARPDVAELVGKATRQGSKGRPLATSRGAGNFVQGSTPEQNAREAFGRLRGIDKHIGNLEKSLEDKQSRFEELQGSGRKTDRLEASIGRTAGQLRTARTERADLAEVVQSITPAKARQNAAAESVASAENRIRIEQGKGLTPREQIEKFPLGTTRIGKDQAEGLKLKGLIGEGKLPNPAAMVQAVLEHVTSPDFAPKQRVGTGKDAKDIVETQAGTVHRLFEDFRESQKPRFKEDRDLGKDFDLIVDSAKQGVLGELRARNEPALLAADQAEGRANARGGVKKNKAGGVGAEIALDRLTGTPERTRTRAASFERQAVRPTTQLDVERQQVEGKRQQALGELPTQIAAQETKVSEAPPSKHHDALVALRGLEGKAKDIGKPFNERLTQIKDAQRAAGFLASQRETGIAGPPPVGSALAPDITGELGDVLATRTPGRQATEADVAAGVAKQVGQIIESGITPEGRPKAAQRKAVPTLTGDEVIGKFLKANGLGFGGGTGEKPDENLPADRRIGGLLGERRDTAPSAPFAIAGKEIAGGAAAAGGGGGNGSRPTANGHGFDGIAGPVHVIVDNVPLQVAWAGVQSTTGGSAGGGAPTPSQQAVFGRRGKQLEYEAFTSEQALKRTSTQVEKLRARGFNDQQISASLTKSGLGQQAALLLEQSSGGTASLNSLRRRLKLDPITRDITGPEAQRVDDRRAALTTEAETAQRKILRRGFTASVTDVLQAPFFQKQNAAVDRFQRESGQLIRAYEDQGKAASLLGASQETLTAAEAAGNKGQIKSAQSLVAQHEVLDRAAKKTVAEQEVLVQQARLKLPGKAAAAGNLAIGGLAAAGAFGLGSVVFQLAGEVLSGVQQALGAAIGPVVERATGFTGTSARVTSAGAQAIQAAGGDRGAIAAQQAPTGISAAGFAAIGPTLTQAAEVEAGNKALQSQIDSLHAAERLQAVGVNAGLTQTTGGILGTPLFGIPSTAEQIGGELTGVPQANAASLAVSPHVLGTSPAFNQIGKTFASDAGPILDEKSQKAFDDALAKSTQRLTLFNSQAEKGGNALVKLANASPDEAEASAKKAESVGLFNLAGKLRESQTAFKGAQNGQDIQSFLAAVNRGSTTPTPELLIESQQRQIKAQREVEKQQLGFQLNTTLPAQQTLQNALNPIGDSGKALSSLGAGKADIREIQAGVRSINNETAAGIKQLVDFVGGTLTDIPNAGKDFASALSNAAGYAKQISDLQIGVEEKQAAYQVAQYNYQLVIAKRNLSDAKALAGQLGKASADNLGAIERQQYILQRKSQALGLELSQRQLNFQRAVAGFTAPGITPEERASRIDEAEQEAAFAQKQLDIQKKLFGLSGKGFQITADRNVRDLVSQINLLGQGKELTISTAVVEKKIQFTQRLLSKEQAKVQAYYEAAVQRTQDVMSLEAQLVAATGKGLNQVAQLAINAFNIEYRGIIRALREFDKAAQATYGQTSPGSTDKKHAGTVGGYASGIVGDTLGPTQITVGEAAGEKVAVIKNPKTMPFAGSPTQSFAGDSSLTINITGNTFSGSKQDMDEGFSRLAQKVGDVVEKRLNTKTSLYGLRH